jgi:hypothetical protein
MYMRVDVSFSACFIIFLVLFFLPVFPLHIILDLHIDVAMVTVGFCGVTGDRTTYLQIQKCNAQSRHHAPDAQTISVAVVG